MKKLTLLLTIVAIALSAKAQKPQKTQLTFDASTAYQPDNYFFGYLVEWGSEPRDIYGILPMFTGQLGIRNFIGRSGWFYEGSLVYNYTQTNLNWGDLTFPDQIDPYYGFVLETQQSVPDMEIREHFHSLGITAGAGYRWQNRKQNRKQNRSFVLPIGIKSYNTFWRKSTRETSDGKSSQKINKRFREEDTFNDWLYYGIYTKPSFEFSLSKKKTSWNFALFADASLIWNANSNLDPSLFLGGGLGVRYEL